MNKKLQGFLELIKLSKKAQLILACSAFVTVAGTVYGVNLLGNKIEIESDKNVSSITQNQNEEDVNSNFEEDVNNNSSNSNTTKPNSDTTKPNSDTTKPNSNTTKPNSNTTKPNSDTTKPNSNTTKPNSDTTKPNSNTTKPNSDTTKPNSDTTKPNSDTTKPNSDTTKPNIANGYNAEMTNYVNSIIRNRYNGTKTSYFDQLLKDLVTGKKSTSQVSSMLEGYQWEENGELELSEVASKSVQVFTVKDKSEIEPKIKRGNYRYWKAQVYYNNGVYTVALLGIEMMDIVINPN